MKTSRRAFLKNGVAIGLMAGTGGLGARKVPEGNSFSGKHFGTIFNNDDSNILFAVSGGVDSIEEYRRAVSAILDMRPGILAQCVGMPDPVIYRSSVATPYDKYFLEATKILHPGDHPSDATTRRYVGVMQMFRRAETDPFSLTIEECRKRDVPILASYRMNSEDSYQATTLMSDFGRAHPDWKIPGANCLDPAIPQVYQHRMAIFREVAERYDIDGIEFDFRRWYHMVSDPLKNYPVLTRMVRETRKMLDQTARKKGRKYLILGARVGPSLDTQPSPFVYPGSEYPTNPQEASCRDLGLDVRTWIAEGLVDYACPSLFLAMLPGMPKTSEFAELAEGTNTGIYPTLWPLSSWMGARVVGARPVSLSKKDQRALAVYKDDLCSAALWMYADGADGISTFNWFSHLRDAKMLKGGWDRRGGVGGSAVQSHIYRFLKNPVSIRRYREEPWAVRTKG